MLLLLTACVATVNFEPDVLGTYEMGWPIGGCSTSMPEGTGNGVGDVLPQYEFLAQTGETVKLHDFCNQVVYIELGYFT